MRLTTYGNTCYQSIDGKKYGWCITNTGIDILLEYYVNDLREGLSVVVQKGIIKRVGYYKDNKLNGTFTTYYDNSIVIALYQDGELYSNIPSIVFDKEVPSTVHFANESPKYLKVDYTNHSSSECITKLTASKSTVRHGITATYCRVGTNNMTCIANYVNDQQHGVCINIINGIISSISTYISGYLHGELIKYDKDSTTIELYDNNLLVQSTTNIYENDILIKQIVHKKVILITEIDYKNQKQTTSYQDIAL